MSDIGSTQRKATAFGKSDKIGEDLDEDMGGTRGST